MSGQALVLASGKTAIAAFDPARVAATLCLPEWVISRHASLEGSRAAPTIPSSLTLTDDERAALRHRRSELRQALRQCPSTDQGEAKATLVVLTKLLLAYAQGSVNERQIEAKGEQYLDALEDVPTWCTVEAVKRWNKGTAGAHHNYSFAPPPAVLGGLARSIRDAADGQISVINRLLLATPTIEMSKEQRTANIARLRGVLGFDVSEVPDEKAAAE